VDGHHGKNLLESVFKVNLLLRAGWELSAENGWDCLFNQSRNRNNTKRNSEMQISAVGPGFAIWE